MYAMRYQLTLPADYDMGIIRRRVATRGHLTDDFEGLGLKAFLIRERGVDGSPVNQYAPFYLWRDISAMNRFLWGGGGFHGIVNDFGRPTVETWTGVAGYSGPASGTKPTLAVQTTEPVSASEDARDLVTRRIAELERLAATPGLHTAAVALDPRTWELVRFELWASAEARPAVTDRPSETDVGERYQVLHISAPDRADIVRGRVC